MLKEEGTRTREQLRKEYSKMQRAQFILWLAEHDRNAMRELTEPTQEMDSGKGLDWMTVRAEMNKLFDV